MSARTILYVEDSDADALLLERALRSAGGSGRLRVVRSAEHAQALFEDTQLLPAVILLDLKLAGLSGMELLRWLKARPVLRRIPVVILSSSDLPEDVEQAYDLGASSYLSKPDTLHGYKEICSLIERYWIGLNRVAGNGADALTRRTG